MISPGTATREWPPLATTREKDPAQPKTNTNFKKDFDFGFYSKTSGNSFKGHEPWKRSNVATSSGSLRLFKEESWLRWNSHGSQEDPGSQSWTKRRNRQPDGFERCPSLRDISVSMGLQWDEKTHITRRLHGMCCTWPGTVKAWFCHTIHDHN